MFCPNAECEGKFLAVGYGEQAVVMEYLEIHNCYVCAWCGIEVWPRSEEKRETTSADAREVLRDQARMQNLLRKPGSSKKAGRKRKDKVVKVEGWWARE